MRLSGIFILILLLLTGCESARKKELRKVLEYWNMREMKIPELQAKSEGRDTILEDWRERKYKILRYVDTAGCTSCRLKLYEWKEFIEETEKEMPEVAVVFVVALDDYHEFEMLSEINGFSRPVLYDPDKQLSTLNQIPSDLTLQTFLLDSLNRVVAIGNPVNSEGIWKLFRQVMGKTVEEEQ